MRFRNSRLRTKVTALLVSLAALWVFAAWVTVRDGINLLWVSTLDTGVAQPSERLVTDLQNERRLTVGRLADPNMPTATLQSQRAATDRAISSFRRLTRGSDVRRAAGPALEDRLRQMYGRLDRIDADRRAIDTGVLDRYRAAEAFTDTIGVGFQIFDSLATLDDKDFAEDTEVLIELNRARELFAQQDALLVGALRSGRLNRTDYTRFVQLVGARRTYTAQSLAELQRSDRVAYQEIVDSPAINRFQATEDQLIQRAQSGSRLSVTPAYWQSVAEPALAQLDRSVQSSGDRLVDRAQPIAIGVVIRLALAGGLGLIAVIASIVVSITTARALVRQLEKLRSAAWVLAEERLPSVVERLGHGEKVDVEAEAPRLRFGDDEIGQVGQAFNAVQETAIRVAVEQAELRRGIRDILLSLARRSQALIHRQLTLLDAMERREMDTKELEDLFRLDHLATRMRRNAENLIVLSGATPARGWRRAVPMMDVVRSAVAEVEDYTRVSVLPMDQVGLTGRAVGDIAHLLAELIENAVSFSPPYTTAQVSGHMTANGYAIEVEDRGLGMSEDNLAAINARIADPPEFNLSSSVQLGLYVVGRLAERYNVRVSLKRSPYGGTTAVVLIPGELLMPEGETEIERGTVATTAGGDHRDGTGPAQDPSLAVASVTAPPEARPATASADQGHDGRGGLTAVPGARPGPAGSPASGPEGAPGRAGAWGQTAPGRPGAGDPAVPPIGDHGNAGRDTTGSGTETGNTPGGGFRPDRSPRQGGLPRRGEPLLTAVPERVSGPTPAPQPPQAPAASQTPQAPADQAGPVTGRNLTGPNLTGGAGGGSVVSDDVSQSDDPRPGSERPVPEMSHTPSGLPFRVPQASLAPPLRADGTAAAERPADEDDELRSPEELRTMLGAYQQGTLRGRSEAAKAGSERAEPSPSGERPDDTAE